MYPMTVGEQLAAPEAPLVDRIARGDLAALGARAAVRTGSPNLRDYLEMALRGGFPQAALGLGERARRSWLDTYVEEIVSRDSQMAGGGYDSVRLARFFEAYSLNSAGVVDDSTLYEAAGINRRTVLRYLHLLGRLHIIDELPAWTSNRLKRLSLAPKRFLVDPSLLASVTGATDRSAMRDGNLLGRLLETLAVAQLRAQATVSAHRCRLYHLRQHHGRHEIDVVAGTGRAAPGRLRDQGHRRTHRRRRPPPRLAARSHRRPASGRHSASHRPCGVPAGRSPLGPADQLPLDLTRPRQSGLLLGCG